jgi:hypothetical protein
MSAVLGNVAAMRQLQIHDQGSITAGPPGKSGDACRKAGAAAGGLR